jgi:hypothetical protein
MQQYLSFSSNANSNLLLKVLYYTFCEMSMYYYPCQYIPFVWLHVTNVNILISDSLSYLIRDVKKDTWNLWK